MEHVKPVMDPVVALCMPIGPEGIAREFFDSYRILDRARIKWHHITVSGERVDVARNLITAEALSHPEITHLLWIDADMVFRPDSLRRLLRHDLDIVGGLCFDRRHPYKPVIARLYDPGWGFDPNTLGWLYDYPPDDLFEVDATGGAFLLVKREVFEKIGSEDWWTPIAGWQAEDLSFCKRARDAGFRLFVDTGCKIGHVGRTIVDEAFAKRNREFEYSQWHPKLDALRDAIRTRSAHVDVGNGLRDIEAENENPRPVATVVIPTYNADPRYLRAAVDSALAQSVPCEVIVVDDGSDVAVDLKDPRVITIRHAKNRGIAAALNTGIRAMATPWFAWLSADDLFTPNKIERCLAAMISSHRLCCYTGYNLQYDNANTIGHVRTPIFSSRTEQNEVLAHACAINGSTVVIHRSVFGVIGLFDKSLRYSQDWEMWRRIGFNYDWLGLPDKLTWRREFENLTALLESARKADTNDPKWQRKLEEDEIVKGMRP
jgi:GT2 family glycosyltransferase